MPAQTAAMAIYTHGHGDEVLRAYRRRTAENAAAYLLPALRPGLDLLDVGCGPGSITVDLAARVAPGRVLGIDAAAAPLEQARELAARAGVAAEFEVGDVYALPLDDDSYDVVHAHQVLQHLTDPVAALREMARVCRPGGLGAGRGVEYAALGWWPGGPGGLVAAREVDTAALVGGPDDAGLDRGLDLSHRVARRNDAEPDAGR